MKRSWLTVPRIDEVFFSNVCSAIRRGVLEQIPFDESLIMSEDQQWSRQVQEAGYHLVYEPKALVRHSHDYSPGQVFKRNFDSGASLVGITHDSLMGMAAYEAGYLLNGVRTLLKRREGRWIPRFLGNEAARVLGIVMGRQARRLPDSITRKLSLHSYHWGRSASG